MAYNLLMAVNFGSTKTGLLTVGYQLKNADGTNNGSRVSGASIKEIGYGYYQANVSIPDGHTGGILWDTGEGTPKYVYQELNPNTGEYVDAKITSRPTASTIDTTLTASHGSGSWQTGGAGSAPTVEQIDAQLTSTHGSGSWQTGNAGTGTNTVTITLQESGGTPKIPGATVAVKNNIDDTLLASLLTDANGQAVFLLNNGTYKIYSTKLGSYSFTNPQTLLVSGNTNASYVGTPISISAPASPNTCRLFIWARNPDGTLMTALTGNIKITALPYKYSGAFHKGSEISFTKHADGYWYVDVIYGAKIHISITDLKVEISVDVPSQTTKDIETYY